MADTISNPTMEPLFFSVDPMSLILSQNTDTHNLKLLLNGLNGFERGPNYDEYSRLRESKLVMKRDFHRLLEEEEEEEETQRKKQVRSKGISVISHEEEETQRKKQVRSKGISVISHEEEEEEKTARKQQVRFEGISVISHKAEEDELQRKNQVRLEGISVISYEDKFCSPEKVKKKVVQTRFGFSPRRAPPSSSLAQSVPDFSAVMRKENRRPVNFNATPPPPSVSKGRNGGVLMGSGSSTYSSSAAARGSKSASAGEMKIKSKGFMGMARKSYASVEDLKKISVAAASAINNGGGGGGGGRKAGGGGGGRTIFGYRQIY